MRGTSICAIHGDSHADVEIKMIKLILIICVQQGRDLIFSRFNNNYLSKLEDIKQTLLLI